MGEEGEKGAKQNKDRPLGLRIDGTSPPHLREQNLKERRDFIAKKKFTCVEKALRIQKERTSTAKGGEKSQSVLRKKKERGLGQVKQE